MNNRYISLHIGALAFMTALLTAQQASAAIALDRTRVIFDAGQKSVSLSVTNENKTLPYLAQAWVEDDKGNKITNPLTAQPPLQRVEPGAKTQVKLQQTVDANRLPQDRESLFYFNLREIPPRASKPNTLQIALQTRVKLFYRPQVLALSQQDQANPWQKKLELIHEGDSYVVKNPTGYYATIVSVSSTAKGNPPAGFNPVMVPPMGSASLKVSAATLGSKPVLTYINDYGGRPELVYSCAGSTCSLSAHNNN